MSIRLRGSVISFSETIIVTCVHIVLECLVERNKIEYLPQSDPPNALYTTVLVSSCKSVVLGIFALDLTTNPIIYSDNLVTERRTVHLGFFSVQELNLQYRT